MVPFRLDSRVRDCSCRNDCVKRACFECVDRTLRNIEVLRWLIKACFGRPRLRAGALLHAVATGWRRAQG